MFYICKVNLTAKKTIFWSIPDGVGKDIANVLTIDEILKTSVTFNTLLLIHEDDELKK